MEIGVQRDKRVVLMAGRVRVCGRAGPGWRIEDCERCESPSERVQTPRTRLRITSQRSPGRPTKRSNNKRANGGSLLPTGPVPEMERC